jgi:fibronectin-binding autotransporter adhesin
MNSAGSVNIGKVSADSLTVTLGTNSARFSAHTLSIVESTNTNNNIVVDGSNYLGVQHFDIVSASGNFTVTAGGPGDVEISAANVGGNLTLDMSTSTSGKAVLSGPVSVSGTTTITLGTQSGGSAATFSALNGVGAITVTGAGFNNDMSFVSVSGQSNVTITSGGSGTVSGSAFDAAGNFTLSAYLGGGEALTLSDVSASGNISVTVTGGSGIASISSINTLGGTFTFDTNASTQTNGAHTIQTVSATAAAVVMGTGDNLNISAMAIGAGGMSVTTDASADITLTLISADGAVTLNQVGGGDFTIGSADLNGAGAFTYNGTGLASGGSLQINSAQISANVVLNYGTDGLIANVSAQDIGAVGSFTLGGSQLNTANIVVGRLSAEGAISIDVGAASGSLNLSAIATSSSFTLDAGAASNLDITAISTLQASGNINVTLGALSAQTHNVQFSSVGTNSALTVNAGAFREDLGFISASANTMTVALGDLVDSFSATEINTVGEFSLSVGGNNGSISANIVAGDFGSSFTITMADIGNGGLKLGNGSTETMTFSASGMIVGTMTADTVSVTSTSGAGELQKIEFYMGESDGDVDTFKLIGGAGKTVATVRHFESGTDKIFQNDQSSNLTQLTFTTAQAASLIADALGLSSDPSESDVQHVVAASAALLSAVWTYNTDAYYIGGDADKDGVLDNGEVVFRFVEVTNFGADSGDFTAIS